MTSLDDRNIMATTVGEAMNGNDNTAETDGENPSPLTRTIDHDSTTPNEGNLASPTTASDHAAAAAAYEDNAVPLSITSDHDSTASDEVNPVPLTMTSDHASSTPDEDNIAPLTTTSDYGSTSPNEDNSASPTEAIDHAPAAPDEDNSVPLTTSSDHASKAPAEDNPALIRTSSDHDATAPDDDNTASLTMAIDNASTVPVEDNLAPQTKTNEHGSTAPDEDNFVPLITSSDHGSTASAEDNPALLRTTSDYGSTASDEDNQIPQTTSSDQASTGSDEDPPAALTKAIDHAYTAPDEDNLIPQTTSSDHVSTASVEDTPAHLTTAIDRDSTAPDEDTPAPLTKALDHAYTESDHDNLAPLASISDHASTASDEDNSAPLTMAIDHASTTPDEDDLAPLTIAAIDPASIVPDGENSADAEAAAGKAAAGDHMSTGEPPRVLLIGATNFIGMQILKELLEGGMYRVRVLLKDARATERMITHLCPEACYPVEVASEVSWQEDYWTQLMSDCTYIIQTSCLILSCPANSYGTAILDQLIGSTLSILRVAQKVGCIRRIIMTGSIGSIIGDAPSEVDKIFTEDDMPDVEKLSFRTKCGLECEKASWKFVREHADDQCFELTVVNPCFVVGPLLVKSARSERFILLMQLLKGQLNTVPRISIPIVDVRDVATAHINALTAPGAANKRHLLYSASVWYPQIAKILSGEFSKYGYRVPTRKVPKMLRWFVGDSAYRNLPGVKREFSVDNTNMKTILGVVPRTPKTTLLDTCHSLIDIGMVKKTHEYTRRSSMVCDFDKHGSS